MGHQLDLFEERAAIKQFDGCFQKGIAEAQARRETSVIVPFELACEMARRGWAISKMIRFCHRHRQAPPPPQGTGTPEGAMGRIVTGGEVLFFEGREK